MTSNLLAARFALFPALQVFALWTLSVGSWWTWTPGILLFVALVIVDSWGGEFRQQVDDPHPVFFEIVIWATVLLTPVLSVGLVTFTAWPGSPLSELGLALRGPDSLFSILGAIASTGFIFGISTAASHELFHRRTPPSWHSAQVALAQYFYALLAIEHVFGHHPNVGQPNDVTTAARGVGFWRYLRRAVPGTYANALRIEARRLTKTGHPVLSLHNRALQGLGVQAVVAVLLIWGGGGTGLAGALVAGFLAILAVETTQYVSHYGVVRVTGRPFEDRHAWNGTRTLSTSLMFNLQRHSAHHRSAMQPFWAHSVSQDAPVYPKGIGMMAFLALFPPVFMRVTGPLLDDWAERLASPEERALLAGNRNTQARFRSGSAA